mgnify:CR=1 FL=1
MDELEAEKIIAEVAYKVLGRHDNETIQEADWKVLAAEIAAEASNLLRLNGALT